MQLNFHSKQECTVVRSLRYTWFPVYSTPTLELVLTAILLFYPPKRSECIVAIKIGCRWFICMRCYESIRKEVAYAPSDHLLSSQLQANSKCTHYQLNECTKVFKWLTLFFWGAPCLVSWPWRGICVNKCCSSFDDKVIDIHCDRRWGSHSARESDLNKIQPQPSCNFTVGNWPNDGCLQS